VDHLDGKVFTDHLSRLKRDRIRKRLVREAKEGLPAPTRENSLVI
jgi:peptide deformylase